MIFSIRASNQYYCNVWNQKRKTDARNHVNLIDSLMTGDWEKAKNILRDDIEEYMHEIIF